MPDPQRPHENDLKDTKGDLFPHRVASIILIQISNFQSFPRLNRVMPTNVSFNGDCHLSLVLPHHVDKMVLCRKLLAADTSSTSHGIMAKGGVA